MASRSTSRWWLRPIWLVGHLLAIVAVVAFVQLGFWQLRRLDERQDRNALIRANLDAPVLAVTPAAVDPVADEYRTLSVEGTWRPGDEVAIRNRASTAGLNGYQVVTPLDLAGGGVLFVNRGWVPPDLVGDDGVDAAVAPTPTDGPVALSGRVRPSQERGSLGPRDPEDGDLVVLNRIDLDRLARQTEGDVEDFYLELLAPAGASPTAVPEPVDEPELSEGPHLSYAIQWFAFTVIVLVGYPLVLRRTARKAGGGAAGEDDDLVL
jgi:cytochrome oxidase assembly protein ShyY1